eukprot:1065831-Pelagomonas_calceolata.AAC.5
MQGLTELLRAVGAVFRRPVSPLHRGSASHLPRGKGAVQGRPCAGERGGAGSSCARASCAGAVSTVFRHQVVLAQGPC